LPRGPRWRGFFIRRCRAIPATGCGSATWTKRFIDGLELFGIGASWGGFESLAILTHPETSRSATTWQAEGPLVRMHIGLEDPDDLIADLAAGFARIAGD
jgi:cystathionine beta-lyase/cystathionine gamma-synthase